MSTPLALAGITAVLRGHVANWLAERHLVAQLGADVVVSAIPPDQISTGADERPQLNLFLYAVSPNTALRNRPPGEAERRPAGGQISLDLHYLISAYGSVDLQIEALLGYAIQALQQIPALDRAAFDDMLAAVAGSSGAMSTPLLAALGARSPAGDVAGLTVSPQFPGVEELSRIWSALQARYRPSIVYRVSAAIIEAGPGGA